jgi:hypothetical protein
MIRIDKDRCDRAAEDSERKYDYPPVLIFDYSPSGLDELEIVCHSVHTVAGRQSM